MAMLAACGGGGGSDDDPPEEPAAPPPIATAQVLDETAPIGQTGMLGPTDATASNSNPPPIPGPNGSTLECGAMDETYHIHSHLSIFLDGQMLAIPANIGSVDLSPSGPGNCFYPVHTHAQSGKIHIEAPNMVPTNLGQLFRIWGQTLSTTEVADLADGKPVVFYVRDGNVVTEHTGDPALIAFEDHREITIQIGTPIAEIPNYTW